MECVSVGVVLCEVFALANPSPPRSHDFVVRARRQIRASPKNVFLLATKRGRR